MSLRAALSLSLAALGMGAKGGVAISSLRRLPRPLPLRFASGTMVAGPRNDDLKEIATAPPAPLRFGDHGAGPRNDISLGAFRYHPENGDGLRIGLA